MCDVLAHSKMKITLKRNHRLFKYQEEFGSTTQFESNLFIGADTVNDVEAPGAVICVPITADKVKSAETGKLYDHLWLWGQIIQAGKASSGGCSPQDGFSVALKGQKATTGEIDTSPAYFQCELGDYDYFTNVKSVIQNEFNKGKRRPVGVGTNYYSEWVNQTLLDLPKNSSQNTEHEWEVVGWDEDHPNCFKIDAHIGFYQWITQKAFNYAMDATYRSVALTLAETTQEKIDFLKQTNFSLVQTLVDLIINGSANLQFLIKSIIDRLNFINS